MKMKGKHIMAKKKETDYEKEDQETTLAPGTEWTKRIVLDLPIWALKKIDQEANRRGIARQALVKNWLVDRVDELGKKAVG